MSNINNVKTGQYNYKGKEYTFNFYTDIDVIKKSKFVTNITDLIVYEDNYQSVLRDTMFDFEIIKVFTNAFEDTEIDEKGYLLADVVDFVENTKVAEIVKANAVDGLINELNEAVDRNIEYKTGIHRNPLGEATASLLKTIENKINDIDLDELMKFAEVFKDMPKDMTPEKLIDAYGKSDVFKQIREDTDKRNEKQTAKILEIASESEKEKKTSKKPRKPRASKTKSEEKVTEKPLETVEKDIDN